MPSEVRFGEVRILLAQHGYALVRISGSHHVFKAGERPMIAPIHHGKVDYVYVREIKKNKPIDRPFDPTILRNAQKIASHYRMMIWSENRKYHGRGVELPWVMSGGKTPDECIQNTREALEVAVACMLER